MRRFVKNIIIFLVIIVVFDFCFGIACDYVNSHTRGGGIAKRYYVSQEMKEDVVMFGSSRMNHHYNPQIIEYSLGWSCFNAGEDGNGIIMSYGFFKMMLKRYTPKLIIYDISGFDVYKDDNIKYIALLKPYCKDPDVMNIITSVDPSEEWKLISNMYRYNSMCLRLIAENVRPVIYKQGYSPINGVMDYEPKIGQEKKREVDSLKMGYIESLIKDCQSRKITLIFSISPRYKGELFASQHPEVKALCERYNVPFVDYYADKDISNDKKMFKDQTHMNHDGADAFTLKLVDFLKNDTTLNLQVQN